MRQHGEAVVAGLFALGLLAVPGFAGAAASAKLIGLDGAARGTANFRSTPHGVLLEIVATGLSPGPHALLIHTSAACDPKTGFATAGPVYSLEPTRPHGYFAKGGPRSGDLPVQFASEDGSLHVTLFTTAFTLGDGAKSLFDADGASVIIHAASDDYLSQPDGHAGARLACGTIIRTAGPKAVKRR